MKTQDSKTPSNYDVTVIGAGLSGLTAAALLAKRGLSVAVVDRSYCPGGSCGAFRRGPVTFDQGAAMLFGFGERGFNSHRFVFNCLEEPISVIRHDVLYCMNFDGRRIRFWPDVGRFAEELSGLFPAEREHILRFYRDMGTLYHDVMVENPSFTTPDETRPSEGMKQFIHHPLSYIRFLSLLNKSAKDLLSRYFSDPEIFKFFDKLTSTYCYTTVAETPAILAAVMFVDNHVGGSWYPAGSTLFLPGLLEKVIEEHGGTMYPENEAVRILFEGGVPAGVTLGSGRTLKAGDIIYSGNVWDLYGRLIPEEYIAPEKARWARNLVPTYPSVVLYAHVDREAVPEGTEPVEMLVGNPDHIDESEVTAYILSLDDRTLCPADGHTIVAIGPTAEKWDKPGSAAYQAVKEREKARLIGVLERRFPGLTGRIRYAEVATPRTLERYAGKHSGAVAGPKQMIGQHLFRRLHIRSEWDTLFCCGESTVMGTGTPAVTVSGISAANAVLRKRNLPGYAYRKDMKNYVRQIPVPCTEDDLWPDTRPEDRAMCRAAWRCRFCENPGCMRDMAGDARLDIRGIMRRVSVGNLAGAKRIARAWQPGNGSGDAILSRSEASCLMLAYEGEPVEIRKMIGYLRNSPDQHTDESSLTPAPGGET